MNGPERLTLEAGDPVEIGSLTLGNRFARLLAQLRLAKREEPHPSNACYEGEMPGVIVPDDLGRKTTGSTTLRI